MSGPRLAPAAVARRRRLLLSSSLMPFLAITGCVAPPPPAPRTVMVDTDLGDDIDDAYALALLLRAPSLRVVAASASVGDTAIRARLLARLLRVAGHGDIPVFAGPATVSSTVLTQRAFATGGPAPTTPFPDAVDGLLRRVRAAPAGSVTLIALAPLFTVAAMIRRDPVAFQRLAGVVMMGGWIRHGYPPRPGQAVNNEPEYNVAQDPDGLRALLDSGVAVTLMPLDATEVPLRPADRAAMARSGALGRSLETLYGQWHRHSPYPDRPTLFDVVPVAWLLQPSVCPTQPMRLLVSATGQTREVAGVPNAAVCLSVDAVAVQAMLDRAVGSAP